jgi:hypothetical protein
MHMNRLRTQLEPVFHDLVEWLYTGGLVALMIAIAIGITLCLLRSVVQRLRHPPYRDNI